MATGSQWSEPKQTSSKTDLKALAAEHCRGIWGLPAQSQAVLPTARWYGPSRAIEGYIRNSEPCF
jgi:hypothetical protein